MKRASGTGGAFPSAEQEQKKGSVTLVGAGCGRGLMTLAGLEEIRAAEVIFYDDLLDPAVLSERQPSCRLIYVGKRYEKHSRKQAEINDLLIREAEAGHRVVRLKGGDSFVFGRGGEEVLALQQAGIPYQVLPGISAGIAVPEHLGIPVTHRGLAQSVTFITGHSASDLEENFQALAALQGTLVFFMGLNAAGQIAEKLIRCGKDPMTPASILSCGYRPGERRIDGVLRDLGEMAAGAETPALLLIGNVAELHMEPSMDLPLTGRSVTVTGSASFVGKMEQKLLALGAYVQSVPSIEIQPDRSAVPGDFSPYSWLAFTSSNGIRIFFETLREQGTDLRSLMGLKFACIGSGTAEQLKQHGFSADFVPSDYTAACMGQELGDRLGPEDHVLILRAENGSPLLTEALTARQVRFTDCKIYHTEALAAEEILHRCSGKTEYLVFGSSMGAKAFLAAGPIPAGTKIICIGEQTARALDGYEVMIPGKHTAEAIAELILQQE